MELLETVEGLPSQGQGNRLVLNIVYFFRRLYWNRWLATSLHSGTPM